jgi:hypothetical protein
LQGVLVGAFLSLDVDAIGDTTTSVTLALE